MSELDPISFRLLLDRVIESARQHFRALFLAIAVPLAACSLLGAVLQIGGLRALSASDDLRQILPMTAGIFLLVFVLLAVYVLGFSALFVGSMDAVAGRPVQMKRAWRFVFRPSVLGTLMLVGLLSFLSFLLCAFPALYVMPIMAFTLAVMVEEDRYGWAAMRRSVQLAHYNPTGRWGDSAGLQTVVLLGVGLIISYSFHLTVQAPFLIAQQITVFRDAASGQIGDPEALIAGALWLQAPAQVLGAFATAASWFYWTFGLSLLYREIRRRQEAEDLRDAIGELIGRPSTGREVAEPVSG